MGTCDLVIDDYENAVTPLGLNRSDRLDEKGASRAPHPTREDDRKLERNREPVIRHFGLISSMRRLALSKRRFRNGEQLGCQPSGTKVRNDGAVPSILGRWRRHKSRD
jgi:hypothetical protein